MDRPCDSCTVNIVQAILYDEVTCFHTTQFTIHAPGNVTADRDIYWEAKVR